MCIRDRMYTLVLLQSSHVCPDNTSVAFISAFLVISLCKGSSFVFLVLQCVPTYALTHGHLL